MLLENLKTYHNLQTATSATNKQMVWELSKIYTQERSTEDIYLSPPYITRVWHALSVAIHVKETLIVLMFSRY
uniref:Putative ovule protein n=1 Tax=Solanum chacoense TaxID=4108 RepID=A0A0V0H1S0_SOLCH